VKVSENIQFVGASNRPGDGSNSNPPGMAFRDRCLWFDVEGATDVKEFIKLMKDIGKPLHPLLSGFLLSPQGSKYFDTFDPNIRSGKYAFSTTRKLEVTSDILSVIAPDMEAVDLHRIKEDVGSAIGAAAGIDMANFVELSKVINLDELLDNPSMIEDIEAQVGTMYSVCVALISKCKSEKNMSKLFMLMQNHLKRDDFGVFLLLGLVREYSMLKVGKVLGDTGKGAGEEGKKLAAKYNEYLRA
jgi:hypothetical protein